MAQVGGNHAVAVTKIGIALHLSRSPATAWIRPRDETEGSGKDHSQAEAELSSQD